MNYYIGNMLAIWLMCSLFISACFINYLLQMRNTFEIGHIILLIIILPITLLVFGCWLIVKILGKFFKFCRKPIWKKKKNKNDDEIIMETSCR